MNENLIEQAMRLARERWPLDKEWVCIQADYTKWSDGTVRLEWRAFTGLAGEQMIKAPSLALLVRLLEVPNESTEQAISAWAAAEAEREEHERASAPDAQPWNQ